MVNFEQPKKCSICLKDKYNIRTNQVCADCLKEK